MQNRAVQRGLNMASLETTLTLIGGPTVLMELSGEWHEVKASLGGLLPRRG